MSRKRKRKLQQSIKAAHTGRISWTVRGIHDCLRHVHVEHAKSSSNEEWEPYSAMMIYLMENYGTAKATAHARRIIHVVDFFSIHEKKLKKAGIVRIWKNGFGMDDDLLLEALAKLPFTRKGFRFEDVMGYIARAKKPN
jgi:hypothetical protein